MLCSKEVKLITSIATVLLLVNQLSYYQTRSIPEPAVWMLDVGQGDSLLVRNREGGYGLVDAGKGNEVLSSIVSVIGTRAVIEFVLITHPDMDHVEGLLGLIDHYKINKIFWNGDQKDSALNNYILTKLQEKQIPLFTLNANNDILWGCCVFIDIVSPKIITELTGNNRSVSAKITIDNKFSLFTGGDIDQEIEDTLVDEIGKVNLLKVAHHGSKSSTSAGMLKSLSPQVAFIGVGKNSYGHPHQDVLSRLIKYSVDIWRTDYDGVISLRFKLDGYYVCAEKRLECREYSL